MQNRERLLRALAWATEYLSREYEFNITRKLKQRYNVSNFAEELSNEQLEEALIITVKALEKIKEPVGV